MRSVPIWVLAWIFVGVGLVIALTAPHVRLPSDALGLRRFQIEIDEATTVSQTFVMTADGFHAIEFAATAAGTPSGALRLQIQEERSGVVRTAEVNAADVVSIPSYRFDFEPILDSKDAVYRLDLASSESNPSKGVAVWVTKGERYGPGAMFINDRERWADMAFSTFAPGGGSSWRKLMDVSAAQPGLSRAHVVFGALAAYWVALGLVLKSLSTLSGASRRKSASAEAARSA